MNKKYQSGFAHLIVITVILAVALVGTLGFVYWQNFIQQKSSASTKTPVVKASSTVVTTGTPTGKATTYKTYKDNQYNFTFKYPDTWSLTTDTSYGSDFSTIKDESGNKVAEFSVGTQLGGACAGDGSLYNVIESEATSIKAVKPVSYSVTGIVNDDGSYDAHYGLTDVYTSYGSKGRVCSNTFYYAFEYNVNDINALGFANSITSAKHFSDIKSLNNYLASDEYKAIKKMILSLTY